MPLLPITLNETHRECRQVKSGDMWRVRPLIAESLLAGRPWVSKEKECSGLRTAMTPSYIELRNNSNDVKGVMPSRHEMVAFQVFFESTETVVNAKRLEARSWGDGYRNNITG